MATQPNLIAYSDMELEQLAAVLVEALDDVNEQTIITAQAKADLKAAKERLATSLNDWRKAQDGLRAEQRQRAASFQASIQAGLADALGKDDAPGEGA